MDEVIIVSADGHAGMPDSAWPDYVEERYHEHLPAARVESERYLAFQRMLTGFTPEALSVMDPDGLLESGAWEGIWDLDRRLAEMDRDGIAAELVIPGDARSAGVFTSFFRTWPDELTEASKRAYQRWAADTFGPATDRLLLLGDVPWACDMSETLATLEWLKDHRFAAVYAPGRAVRGEFRPLYDESFDPYWAKCVELGLPVVMHAGHGKDPEKYTARFRAIVENMEAHGRNNLLEEIQHYAEDFFQLDLRPRQLMWQMMLGGVFDRHPDLRLFMIELRGDWLPATLGHLDETYLRARADLPAKKLPSEYWQSNCLAGLSFMHKCEVEMRHDIGIETMAFGRDYPHPEGTWPNTNEWLTDLFAGVPERDVRQILGENMVRFLGLDRERLAAVATRVGPTVDELTGRTTPLDPKLAEIFQNRGGYLKPREQIDTEAIDALLAADLAGVAQR